MTSRPSTASRTVLAARACGFACIPLLLHGTGSGFAETPAPASPAVEEAFEEPATGAKLLPPAAAPYPAPVQAALDDARLECKDAEGGDLVTGPGLVRTGDLTGDGRADFVVDFREARCAEIATLFSGTGGATLAIFVARKAGEPVRAFSGHVLDYDLEPGSGPRTIRFQLHGSFCGRVGASPCLKRRRLSERPFTLEDRR